MGVERNQSSWNVLEVLNWTAEHFRSAGIESARLNAEVLLGKVLGLERIVLYARFERELTEAERTEFRELVRRRAAREPLQYLTGRCEFYGREFEVTSAVMCPRQETELVVEMCLEKMPNRPIWVADVCTGSGVIAVTLADERPEAHLVAADSSADALDVARRNAARHGVDGRILFAEGDLLEPVGGRLPSDRAGWDLIVSNPPYVPTAAIEGLQPEVRDHEPRRALDGGDDGLSVIRRLVPGAARLLAPGGWLVLEMGEGQADAVRQTAAASDVFAPETIETVTDAGGCERVFSIARR